MVYFHNVEYNLISKITKEIQFEFKYFMKFTDLHEFKEHGLFYSI